MSHELRTPLNAILGFGQLLELEPLEAEPRQSVERILKAGRHLLQLINEVLEVTRIEAGVQHIALAPVHVCEPLNEALELVRPLARERGIELSVDMHGGLHRYVSADFQRLKQVLLNLLSNAVKYNREEGWCGSRSPTPARACAASSPTPGRGFRRRRSAVPSCRSNGSPPTAPRRRGPGWGWRCRSR